MKSLLPLLLAAVMAVSALAQTHAASNFTVHLKDGRNLVATAVSRSGSNIRVTVSLGPAGMSQMGFPIANVTSIDFPESPVLKSAAGLLAQGKAAAALAILNPVVAEQAGFQEVPGNYWAKAANLKLQALVALGKLAEAEAMAAAVGQKEGPEQTLQARLQIARGWAKAGNTTKAAVVFDEVIAKSTRPATLAQAWVSKGEGQLEAKDFDGALLSFLRVPIFYSDQATIMPAALLGSARAYAGVGDSSRERETLQQLTTEYAQSPEAATAKDMLKHLGGGTSS